MVVTLCPTMLTGCSAAAASDSNGMGAWTVEGAPDGSPKPFALSGVRAQPKR
jgi:hypothetical protein